MAAVPLDPQVAHTLRKLGEALGGDSAHHDALAAVYQIGFLAGHDTAKAQASATLTRTIGSRLPRVPLFLRRQAGYVRLDFDPERNRRFFRSAREAFGGSLDFRAPRNPDRVVGIACIAGALLMLVFGW